MIYFGNKKITDLNYGGTPIKEAYYGNTLVWRKQVFEGMHNFHSWVDLDLPSGTLWATMNIGANTNYDYGDYFAWGETSRKSLFNLKNYEHLGMAIDEFSGQERFDAATANWGGGWRTPTYYDISELVTYCTARIVQLTDSFGQTQSVCRIQGTNGKFIYMPLSGYYSDDSLEDDGINGHYWCSTPSMSGSDITNYAFYLYVYSSILSDDSHHIDKSVFSKWYGFTIRPVLDRSSLNL